MFAQKFLHLFWYEELQYVPYKKMMGSSEMVYYWSLSYTLSEGTSVFAD
jgi:hypothetical protein